MSKRPLEGIKVVELATFIAAPCTARVLADLGADVIKVEAPMGDPLEINVRGYELSLRKTEAQEIMVET